MNYPKKEESRSDDFVPMREPLPAEGEQGEAQRKPGEERSEPRGQGQERSCESVVAAYTEGSALDLMLQSLYNPQAMATQSDAAGWQSVKRFVGRLLALLDKDIDQVLAFPEWDESAEGTQQSADDQPPLREETP